MFNHRLCDTRVGVDHRPHGPDVVGGDDGDSFEQPRTWARDDAPTGAVPLLDEGLDAGAIYELPHLEEVHISSCVWLGYLPFPGCFLRRRDELLV